MSLDAPPAGAQAAPLAIADAASVYCRAACSKSYHQYAVVGGSSQLWKYRWPSDVCKLYDNNVAALRVQFQANGISNCDGSAELNGIQVADCVGHVAWQNKDIVFAAYCCWLNRALPPLPCPFDVGVVDDGESVCAVPSVDSDVAVVTTCPQTSVPQQPSLSAPSLLCVPSTCAQGMTEEVEVEVAVRPWGFVELQRGEFDVIFGMLVSQAFNPEPLDLLDVCVRLCRRMCSP